MTLKNTQKTAWQTPMPQEQFNFMKKVLASPSPIGFEAAMSYGVIKLNLSRSCLQLGVSTNLKGMQG
ncbi:hypothetical protein JCM19233_6206 [Vibrio astriarenae]|nr:hypothetical protein JCM19233_6206 [Vibrio sp. C7]